MIRNWYAVYTRPGKEKKVALLLNKKEIENYCPVIYDEHKPVNKRSSQQALFNSYVFVHIAEDEISNVLSLSWVINVIYWRSKPAVISNREIDIVKKLTSNYSNIKLQKTFVDVNASITILDEPTIAYNENTVSVNYKSIKVNLPSLGYTMIAERIKEKKDQQQISLLSSFPRRINAFFFN